MKIIPVVSKKLRQASKGRACVRCEFHGALSYKTTVRCHYTGIRQHAFGKGKGIKGSDLASADLCYDCHRMFDENKLASRMEASEEFLFWCLVTLHRDIASGLIKIGENT